MLIPSGQKKLGLFAFEERAGASVARAKRKSERDTGNEMKTRRGCYN